MRNPQSVLFIGTRTYKKTCGSCRGALYKLEERIERILSWHHDESTQIKCNKSNCQDYRIPGHIIPVVPT